MQENVTIPGFFFSPSNITHGNIGQRGQPFWKIRFTPRYPGEYVAVITTRDRSGSVSSERHYFTAVAKPFKGFLRVAKHQPFALELSDGSAFHAVGCNLDKYHRPSSAPPTDRLSYLLGFVNTLGEHGGNYVRFRTDLAYEALESAPSLIAQYLGVGFYQQQIAFEIDTVLARAESVGVYAQMSLYNEDCIVNDGRPDKMRFSPFLKSHGGPLKDGNLYVRAVLGESRCQGTSAGQDAVLLCKMGLFQACSCHPTTDAEKDCGRNFAMLELFNENPIPTAHLPQVFESAAISCSLSRC